MIILDTNVLSELMRIKPDPSVIRWVNALPAEEMGITVITVSEILYGIGKLPGGKRKQNLCLASEKMFEDDFHQRVYPFDEHAAVEYSLIVLKRERSGRPISMADAQIASICRSMDLSLATRNTNDFQGIGLKLINPWEFKD